MPRHLLLLIPVVLAAFSSFLFIAWPGNAATDAGNLPAGGAAESQALTYEIYGGGLKALTAQLNITESAPGNYQMAMASQTSGLAAFLTDWSGRMTTEGQYTANGGEVPVFHEMVSVWPDKTSVKRFSYTPDGNLRDITIIEDGKQKPPKGNVETLAHHTVDLMTAALQLMDKAGRQGTCNIKTEVFDGKRRFVLRAQKIGEEFLEASRYNIFEGPAIKCEISVTPLAGEWGEKLKGWMAFTEEGREAGTLPIVWLGQPDPSAPAVPVKIRTKTKYGTFFAHLTGYKNGGAAL